MYEAPLVCHCLAGDADSNAVKLLADLPTESPTNQKQVLLYRFLWNIPPDRWILALDTSTTLLGVYTTHTQQRLPCPRPPVAGAADPSAGTVSGCARSIVAVLGVVGVSSRTFRSEFVSVLARGKQASPSDEYMLLLYT